LSLGKAAEVAGVATKLDMLGVLARHDVYVDYTADDAIADADAVQQLLKQ
jgi:predicted HTH domain antitoxin